MHRTVLITVASIGVLAIQIASGDDPATRSGVAAQPGPYPAAQKVGPKTGGTENDPLIQLEVTHRAPTGGAEALLAALNQLPWASRTAVQPHHPGIIAKERWRLKATAVVAVGERQWADVVDLVRRVSGDRVYGIVHAADGFRDIAGSYAVRPPGR